MDEAGDPPEFLGNVSELYATVHKDYKDKWLFNNSELMDPGNSCFVRCSSFANTTLDPQAKLLALGSTLSVPAAEVLPDELHLYIELICHVQLSKEDHRQGEEKRKRDRKIKMKMDADKRRQRQEDLGGDRGGKDKATTSGRGPLGLSRSFTFGLSKDKKEANNVIEDSELDDRNVRGRSRSGDRRGTGRGRGNSRSQSRGRTDSDDDVEMEADPEVEQVKVKDREDATETNADNAVEILELCCAWVMIPIAATLKSAQSKKFEVSMCGGTPFRRVRIQSSDVKNRPGMWQAIKRAVGWTVKSKLELSLTRSRFSEQEIQLFMPFNVILPSEAVNMVLAFRQRLINAQRNALIEVGGPKLLPQTGKLATADPVLSGFPRMLADPAACRVLIELMASRRGGGTSTNTYGANDVFQEVVLRVWEAYSSPEARPDRRYPLESLDRTLKRELYLRECLGMHKPAPLERTANIGSELMKESLANSKDGSLRASGQKESGWMQSMGATSKPKDVNVVGGTTVVQQRTFVPFDARELMWQEAARNHI